MRDLVEENRRRGKRTAEFELLDTGIFDEDRYFDVFVEYAKADVEDILITHHRHQSRPGTRRLCICCPRSGSATPGRGASERHVPDCSRPQAVTRLNSNCPDYGKRWLYCEGCARVAVHGERNQYCSGCSASTNAVSYVKDGINDYIVHGRQDAVNPEQHRHQGRRPLSTDNSRRAKA